MYMFYSKLNKIKDMHYQAWICCLKLGVRQSTYSFEE